MLSEGLLSISIFTRVVALASLLVVGPAFAQSSSDEAWYRSFIHSIGKTLFFCAWPTDTYDHMEFGSIAWKSNGADVSVVLYGDSWLEGKVWTETILHNFANNGTDGNTPCCGELVLDGAGDLYGVTGAGGTNNYGAVFELTPTGGGNWTETVLHSFSSGTGDGYFPQGGLTLDGKGNLYGTTVYGGAYGYGTVFELTPAGGGSWTEAIIHSFEQTISGTDGSVPSSDLVIDSAGNLYGTAGDGLYSLGVVFELSPAAGASWSEAILHNFQQTIPGTDGYTPGPMLVFDGSGNLYGTTYYGGADNGGTVFELTP